MNQLHKITVNKTTSIKEAIRCMDEGGIGLVCVTEEKNGKLLGIVTDGDFRRALLKDISLSENIQSIWNQNFRYINYDYLKNEVQEIFLNEKIRHIPVVRNGLLQDVITEEEFFGIKNHRKKEQIDCSVVIMAGGKGTRLDPFTRILPKPLIPIGDKAMIEIVIDEFRKYGVNDFFISVNHKAKMIKAFFEERVEDYVINYIDEDRPLGTAGALRELVGKVKTSFFVSNCDIFIKESLKSIMDFHKKGNFSLTIVASLQHHEIPYGVCKLSASGDLHELIEKPEYDFLVNTGVYVLEPGVLSLIPENKLYHITNLINDLMANNERVGVYPVSQGSWIDVGEYDKYSSYLNSKTFIDGK